MSKWKYISAALPRGIVGKNVNPDQCAQMVEKLVNSYAEKGWEYVDTTPFTLIETPGCLGSLFGGKAESYTIYVCNFRAAA